MKKIFLDIETLPAGGKDVANIKKFYKESNQKKIKQSNQKLKVDFETYLRNTSFQGEFGRILCIGYAINNQKAEVLSGEEADQLKNFWQMAEDADLFIGHNIMDFDLKFIYQRSIINKIKPSRKLSFARYRSEPIFDTMKEWEMWGGKGVGLDRLSIALGIESPKSEGIDGSQVYDYYLDGKVDQIYKYCVRDVEATRKIYKKITFSD